MSAVSLSSALLVLASLAVPAHPSVDASFREPRYATLYDLAHRIPLYSAYTFRGSDGEKMDTFPWMYEPQLVSGSDTGNMLSLPPARTGQRLEESQAVLADYTENRDFQLFDGNCVPEV